jgi:hypothetical protein
VSKKKPPVDLITDEVCKRLEGLLTNEEYMEQDGYICPCCKSTVADLNVIYEDELGSGEDHIQIVRYGNKSLNLRRLFQCEACGNMFWDHYALTGFIKYEEGSEEDEDF